MSKDGGSAFPLPAIEWSDGTADAANPGMSLRDYFATHAPAQPWSWFDPKMPPEPVAPPVVGNDGEAPTDDEQRTIDNWLADPCYDLADHLPHFSCYAKACRTHEAEKWQWERERKRQRDIQWPWFYANTMLKARDES